MTMGHLVRWPLWGLIILVLVASQPINLRAYVNLPGPGMPVDLKASWLFSDGEYGYAVVLEWNPGNPSHVSIDDPEVKADATSYELRRDPPFVKGPVRHISLGGAPGEGFNISGRLHQSFTYVDPSVERDKLYTYYLTAFNRTSAKKSDETSVSIIRMILFPDFTIPMVLVVI